MYYTISSGFILIFLECLSLESDMQMTFVKDMIVYSVTYHQIMFSKIYINFLTNIT